MDLIIFLLKIIAILWAALVIIMLPAYFIRRRKNPDDKGNTFKSLLIKAFIACAIITLIMGSGLIVMYIKER